VAFEQLLPQAQQLPVPLLEQGVQGVLPAAIEPGEAHQQLQSAQAAAGMVKQTVNSSQIPVNWQALLCHTSWHEVSGLHANNSSASRCKMASCKIQS